MNPHTQLTAPEQSHPDMGSLPPHKYLTCSSWRKEFTRLVPVVSAMPSPSLTQGSHMIADRVRSSTIGVYYLKGKYALTTCARPEKRNYEILHRDYRSNTKTNISHHLHLYL